MPCLSNWAVSWASAATSAAAEQRCGSLDRDKHLRQHVVLPFVSQMLSRSSANLSWHMSGFAAAGYTTRPVSAQGNLWKRKGWKEMDKMRAKLEDLKELRDLVRSLGRGGGWGPLRRAPIQYLDMRGRPGLLRTVLEQQETRGLTRSDDISRLLPSEVRKYAASEQMSGQRHRLQCSAHWRWLTCLSSPCRVLLLRKGSPDSQTLPLPKSQCCRRH